MSYPARPLKLEDCTARGADTELFIVEGDSAAMAVAAARSMETQAVLPMQGKPMNTHAISQAKLLANPWFAALIDAIGLPLSPIGKSPPHDLTLMRYQRVMLLLDPDADGIHAGALLLMFFQRWMPTLLASGRVWMVRAPVGEIRAADGTVTLAYSEPHFLAQCQQAQAAARDKGETITTVRYRGLASVGADVLVRTCLDPSSRVAHAMGAADAAMVLEVFGGAKT